MVRILSFCQVCLRGSRISLLQQSQEQEVPKQYPTNWTKMIREGKTSPYSSWLFWLVVFQSLSCVRLCNPMDCSMPGFPVLHYLPEFAQTHPTISSSVTPLLLPSIFPSIKIFSTQGLKQHLLSLWHWQAGSITRATWEAHQFSSVAQSCLTH